MNLNLAVNCRLRRLQASIALEAECLSLRDQVRYLTQMVNELNKKLYETTHATYYEPTVIDVQLIQQQQQPIVNGGYSPTNNQHAIISNVTQLPRVSMNTSNQCFYTMQEPVTPHNKESA